MLVHYIKLSFKNFRHNKVVFSGSLFTLLLSTLGVVFLCNYIYYQLSMDDIHAKKERIFMVIAKPTPESLYRPLNISFSTEFNYKKYPELEAATQVLRYNDLKLEVNQHRFKGSGLVVDSLFFKVFDFKIVNGDNKSILKSNDQIVITESFAKILFGNINPIGKQIKIPNHNNLSLTVSAVVKTPEANSSITFDYLIPFQQGFYKIGADFVLANPSFNRKQFEAKIKNSCQDFLPYKKGETTLVSLSELYFNKTPVINNAITTKHASMSTIYILIALMVVLVVISTVNIANLQIININKSFKKAGILQINGATKTDLIFQKLVEGIFYLIFALIGVLVLYRIILPSLNSLLNQQLNYHWLLSFAIILISLLISLTVSLCYPLFKLVKLSSVHLLYKTSVVGGYLTSKKHIIIFQYAVTALLIFSSLAIAKQLHFLLHKNMGLHTSNVVSFHLPSQHNEAITHDQEALIHFSFLKNELRHNQHIAVIAMGNSPLNFLTGDYKLKNSDASFHTVNFLYANDNYGHLLDLKLSKGRFFNEAIDGVASTQGSVQKVVINEAAAKLWNINELDNVLIQSKFSTEPLQVIGVLKDFNYEHLKTKPKPLIIIYAPVNSFLIRFKKQEFTSGMIAIQELLKKMNNQQLVPISILSEAIQQLYTPEKKVSAIYFICTLIAILIAVVGLFSIAFYHALKTKKEIGIRKVNGAKLFEIITFFNVQFFTWICFALVIALPIAYYFTYRWLQNFAYKTTLSWWLFVFTGLIVFGIAILTVSWQSYVAATVNPSKVLKDE
ncbi:ABC transporter permease [Zhouia sp. PK063]|uniref:ABC transporter permease n=1 Tax=Zhouia sp. PK063 TaxID=3373602 RepID=UPI00379A1B27